VNPGLRILRWTWALVLSLAFIVAGLALAGGGALFAYVGVRGALNAEDGGHLVAGALFAVGGGGGGRRGRADALATAAPSGEALRP